MFPENPVVKKVTTKNTTRAKVHVELEELARLQFDQHRFSFLPQQPIHSLLSGRHASRLRGRGLLFEELRHYRPGDDIRSMDWRATARLRKAHVRVYSEERERTVLFVVDQRQRMHFGSVRATKAVAAAELAALGAWRTLRMGDRVAALVFNDKETAYVPPHRSRATVMQVCNELTRMNKQLRVDGTADTPAALNTALQQVGNLARHDHLIVLVTDCYGADAETRKHVSRLAAHNDMIATLVYDPLGIRLPIIKGLEVSDGLRRVIVPPEMAFGKKYEADFVKWGQLIRDRFSALKIPVLPICTHDDVGDQVLRALGYNA